MSCRSSIIDWIAREILPHESSLRSWLRRRFPNATDIDDIIQEAYCQIAKLEAVDHIGEGRAYFFATARSLMLQRLRRAKVVSFEPATDMELAGALETEPALEVVVEARIDLGKVLRLIEGLPDPYRHAIELRRLEGLSQKETAYRLGVTEKVVENNSARGLKMILKALAKWEERPGIKAGQDGRTGNRAGH